MAFVGNRRGLQDPIYDNTVTVVQQQIHFAKFRQHGKYIFKLKYNRISTRSRFKIFIYFIWNTGSNQNTTGVRLQINKPIHTMQPLQDGGCTSAQRNHSTTRLDMQNRFEGCVRGSSDSPGLSTIPIFSPSRSDISIQNPTFWNECIAPSLLQTDEVRNATTKGTGDKIDLLLGRHMHLDKITTNDGTTISFSNESSTTIGLHNQSHQKRFDTKKNTRIPRFLIQHKQYDDQSTREKIEKTLQQDQTSNITTIMSMGGRFIGENDEYVTSNRGCIDSHSLFTEGFGKELEKSTLQLGKAMSTITISDEGTGMVDESVNNQERSRNKTSTTTNTNRYNIRRRFEYGMGNQISKDSNMGTLVKGRKRTIHQRQGTQDDFICTSTSSECICPQDHRNQKRQQHSNKICHEARGNSITHLTSDSSGNQHIINRPSNNTQLQSHSGNQQHYSRQIESLHANIRMEDANKTFTNDMSEMALQDQHRRICRKDKQQNENILELQTGSSSNSDRCIPTTVANNRDVHVSSLAIDITNNPTLSTATNQISNTGHTILANATLVATSDESSTQGTMENSTIKIENPGRMVIIQQEYQKRGLQQEASLYVTKNTKASTAKAYDQFWNQWWKWCLSQSPQENPTAYNPHLVTTWLTNNQHLSSSQLNIMRSSLATVYKVLYPNEQPLASTPSIMAFFQAKRRKQPVKTDRREDIWDIKIILDHIRNWGENQELSIQKLQSKVLVLLCIATFWRPRSDVGRLLHQDIQWLYEDGTETISGVRILARNPKEGQQKFSTISTLDQQPNMCVVKTLKLFMEKTTLHRIHLPVDHSLFLIYMEHQVEQPKNMCEKTAAKILKTIMEEAGIDVKRYTPHSIRAASVTAAYENGIKRKDIKIHGNWSLKTSTLERYYLKSTKRLKKSKRLMRKMILE
jgi:hypothetical protein